MASSSPVPWMEKNTGTSGRRLSIALTTPSVMTSVRAKAPQKLTSRLLTFGFFSTSAQRGGGLGVGVAADLQEVGRAAAVVVDGVEGGHGEPRAVGEHAHAAVELDELQTQLGAFVLEDGCFLGLSALQAPHQLGRLARQRARIK